MDNEKELTVADLIDILKSFKQDSNIELNLGDNLLKKMSKENIYESIYCQKKDSKGCIVILDFDK